MRRSRVPVVLLLSMLVACGGGDSGTEVDGGDPITIDAAPGAADAAPLQRNFGGDRRVRLQIPDDFDPTQTYPLVMILHGYSATGLLQQSLFHLGDLADEGVLVLAPDGTVDSSGKQFWNASDGCCDHDGTGVDDVGYLSGVLEEVMAVYSVDRARVYLVGHSNGSFMAYRMACERPDLITGIVGLAGAAAFNDPATCVPGRAVNVLHLHGTADDTILYEGAPRYPGAEASVDRWATYDGCSGARTATGVMDLNSDLEGDETTVETVAGCPAGVAVELWKMEGGAHLPLDFVDEIGDLIWGWLAAHPRT